MAKAKEQIELRRQGGAHVVRIGEREIETRGLSDSFWTDLYHRSMTVYWPVFFGTAAAIFIILNALFAFLYWLGDEPIANVAGNEPLGLFYFSIETLATVGYGDMHPQTHYGHFIATVEIFTGMCIPRGDDRADLRPFFAPPRPLHLRPICRRDRPSGPADTDDPGRQCPQQYDFASDCAAMAVSHRNDHEGYELRRYHELLLERREHPMFMLSWSIFHTIDETSPLYRMTAADLAAVSGSLTLNVSGVDDSSAQHLYARRIYSYEDIRWNHRYRDITGTSNEGKLVIDYSVFHEVEAE